MAKRKHPIVLGEWDDVTQKIGPIYIGDSEQILFRRFLTTGLRVEQSRDTGLVMVYNYDVRRGLTSEKTGSFAFPPGTVKVKSQVTLGHIIDEPESVTIVDPSGRQLFVVEKNIYERGIIL